MHSVRHYETLKACKIFRKLQLLDIMRLLRDPQRGCPWDLEQNYQTIVPHTLEEARLIYADKL